MVHDEQPRQFDSVLSVTELSPSDLHRLYTVLTMDNNFNITVLIGFTYISRDTKKSYLLISEKKLGKMGGVEVVLLQQYHPLLQARGSKSFQINK